MSNSPKQSTLPRDQQAIRDRCFHPSGRFIEFPAEDIENSIPARFEKMVRLYPDRIAVKSPGQQFTYTELNGAANRVANGILSRCGESSEPVGLLFPKSIGFVVSMLGILKAGKIAVPVDPEFPQTRLAAICQDMQARLFVGGRESQALAENLAGPSGFLSTDDLNFNKADDNPNISISPDALACLFYTSGSTGLPKGVMENHRNLLYLGMRDTNDYQICREDKLTLLASSGRDIFRSLLNGAALYPIDIRQAGFSTLSRVLLEEEVTIFNCVTSAFRGFAGGLTDAEQFPHLRLIKLTGETMYKHDFELYKKHFSDACILVNSYGPNEAGPMSRYLMDHSSAFESHIVPVGYPLPGKDIALVDESNNRVGVGEIGEILTRSRYLSLGYWRQPELTSALFAVDPADAKVRTYRTGDMATMAPDGCLVHLGRKDFQVKIRGNKVQLPAVETALLNLPAVKEAAVIAVDDAEDKRLIAYLVTETGMRPTASALRDALRPTLPVFMIPSVFVFLDRLPVTGIGKVDRRALPLPGKSRPRLEVAYVAPRSAVESRLSVIWSEVLGLAELGVHDSFFHLGGDSLSAMRLIAKIVQSFQLELPVKALFESPTIAEMAAIIAQHQAERASEAKLARMLSEIEAMTEEQAQQKLADKRAKPVA